VTKYYQIKKKEDISVINPWLVPPLLLLGNKTQKLISNLEIPFKKIKMFLLFL
jgi:hypothetical protein